MEVVKYPPLTENALSLITERIFYWAKPVFADVVCFSPTSPGRACAGE